LSLLKEGVIWKQNGVVHSMQQLNKLLEIRDDIKGHLSNGDGEKNVSFITLIILAFIFFFLLSLSIISEKLLY
jgi:hypothetical protein